MGGRGSRQSRRPLQSIADYSMCKLMLIGDWATGKTCAWRQFADCSEFSNSYLPTIGADFTTRLVHLNDSLIKLHIWDTAGQERYRTITQIYFRGVEGIIIFYDVGRKETFDSVPYWVQEARSYGCPGAVLMIVGTKSDVTDKREVTYEAAKTFADEEDLLVFEVSAKDGTNIDLALITLVAKIKSQNSQS